MRTFITLLLLVVAAAAMAVPAADDILGVWNNQEKDAKIEIYRCGERFCGRIVWLKIPDYPEGSTEGIPGTPKLDHNNPDPKLRSRQLMGLDIVKGFVFHGGNKWTDGTVYDPKKGKTYSGIMTLVAPGRLHLRGYIGISLFGRTTTWTR